VSEAARDLEHAFSLTLSLPEGSSPRVFVVEKKATAYVVARARPRASAGVAAFRSSRKPEPCLVWVQVPAPRQAREDARPPQEAAASPPKPPTTSVSSAESMRRRSVAAAGLGWLDQAATRRFGDEAI